MLNPKINIDASPRRFVSRGRHENRIIWAYCHNSAEKAILEKIIYQITWHTSWYPSWQVLVSILPSLTEHENLYKYITETLHIFDNFKVILQWLCGVVGMDLERLFDCWGSFDPLSGVSDAMLLDYKYKSDRTFIVWK